MRRAILALPLALLLAGAASTAGSPWTLGGDVLAFSADAGHTWREVAFKSS